MLPEPRASIELREWIKEEEHELIYLRDQRHLDFDSIGYRLERTPNAAKQRYRLIKQRQYGSGVDWTAEHDAHIIDGRGRALTIKEIADEMKIPHEAIADRWVQLLRDKAVPEDVLVIWRRKGDVEWTAEEDEPILKIWMEMKSDIELIRMVNFKGKSRLDIKERRSQLVNGHSPMYLKMLGVGNGKENVPTGLQKALGKPKYSWIN